MLPLSRCVRRVLATCGKSIIHPVSEIAVSVRWRVGCSISSSTAMAGRRMTAVIARHVLADRDLTEPQWVTLRLAAQNDSAAQLALVVRERAHFNDATGIIEALNARGRLVGDALTAEGRALVRMLQSQITSLTGPVWAELNPDDITATERVLTTVTSRAGRILDSLTM